MSERIGERFEAYRRAVEAAETPSGHDGARDFDFLHGDWRVRHRRLSRRLARSDDWVEFGGTTSVRPILGGLGNFDENRIGLPSGPYEACTLRLFDRTRGEWTIYWIDGRDPKPDAPMRGRFAGRVGTFFGDELFEGQPIRVRFLWTVEGPRQARWEQAFSPDSGRSWETNWIMDFHRA